MQILKISTELLTNLNVQNFPEIRIFDIYSTFPRKFEIRSFYVKDIFSITKCTKMEKGKDHSYR
jgi:hypothetical protein